MDENIQVRPATCRGAPRSTDPRPFNQSEATIPSPATTPMLPSSSLVRPSTPRKMNSSGHTPRRDLAGNTEHSSLARCHLGENPRSARTVLQVYKTTSRTIGARATRARPSSLKRITSPRSAGPVAHPGPEWRARLMCARAWPGQARPQPRHHPATTLFAHDITRSSAGRVPSSYLSREDYLPIQHASGSSLFEREECREFT